MRHKPPHQRIFLLLFFYIKSYIIKKISKYIQYIWQAPTSFGYTVQIWYTYTTCNITHNSHPLLRTHQSHFKERCKACCETGGTTVFSLLRASLVCSQLFYVYTVCCLVLFNITRVSPRLVSIYLYPNNLNSCQVMSCPALKRQLRCLFWLAWASYSHNAIWL